MTTLETYEHNYTRIQKKMGVSAGSDRVHTASPPYFFVERYKKAYLSEMQMFIRCIKEDKEPTVTGEDGRVPIVIGYAALKSLRENRPILLSEIS